MMTKKQLREALARFKADPNRIVSVKHLCELAGISVDTFQEVILWKERDITPTVQIRLERALEHLKNGEVKVVQHGQKYSVGYRRKPQPEMGRHMGLTMKGGKIGLKIGMKNVNDYTAPTFKEELWRS